MLVEVGADGSRRACVCERVATAAALDEEFLSARRRSWLALVRLVAVFGGGLPWSPVARIVAPACGCCKQRRTGKQGRRRRTHACSSCSADHPAGDTLAAVAGFAEVVRIVGRGCEPEPTGIRIPERTSMRRRQR
jgi:hypothetical protein